MAGIHTFGGLYIPPEPEECEMVYDGPMEVVSKKGYDYPIPTNGKIVHGNITVLQIPYREEEYRNGTAVFIG